MKWQNLIVQSNDQGNDKAFPSLHVLNGFKPHSSKNGFCLELDGSESDRAVWQMIQQSNYVRINGIPVVGFRQNPPKLSFDTLALKIIDLTELPITEQMDQIVALESTVINEIEVVQMVIISSDLLVSDLNNLLPKMPLAYWQKLSDSLAHQKAVNTWKDNQISNLQQSLATVKQEFRKELEWTKTELEKVKSHYDEVYESQPLLVKKLGAFFRKFKSKKE